MARLFHIDTVSSHLFVCFGRSSFFLTGFYTLSLVCLSLILKFGVLVAIHPPNQTLRGLFVLACGVAGIAGGGVSIFFWQQAKYFIGAWGGFSIGLWVQCLRNGGLIRPIGFRWILYIGTWASIEGSQNMFSSFLGCGAVGFVLCTIPKLHYHILITGTAITGASAFILGVDCFTTAGLKEVCGGCMLSNVNDVWSSFTCTIWASLHCSPSFQACTFPCHRQWKWRWDLLLPCH